ncbi:MAG: cytochrome c oxidase subunit II [Spirulinaceae cyanobacterium]
MNIPSSITTLIAGIALTLVSLWYGQNHGLLPVQASAEAAQVDGIFDFMMTIATGLFFLVQGVLIFSVIKFRRRKGDQTDGPPIEGNIPLEILWTAIPTVIVFIIAIYSFEVYNTMGGLDPMASMDNRPQQNLVALNPSQGEVALGLGSSPYAPTEDSPLEVDVNGLQYAWIFTYPETGVISGDLHIPLGREVKLNIAAQDVLHAFWLPEFRIKQDAIPGRTAQLRFTATRPGQYPIICAELCGPYHGGMKAQLFVQTPEEYNQWMEENSQYYSQNQLDKAVALQTANNSPAAVIAPFAEDMGVTPQVLDELHALHHHQ